MSCLPAQLVVVIYLAGAVGPHGQLSASAPVPGEPVAATNAVATTATASATNTTAPTNSAPEAASVPLIDPFDDPLIKAVQARHEKAVNGDSKEAKSLTSDLEKWTRDKPDNHLLQAYLGSVYTLDSRDAWPGPGKLNYLKTGGKLLDAAVAAEPDNPAVRFIRAIDYFELPSIFGKRQTAREDFLVLLRIVEGLDRTPYILNVETQQAIYYFAGLSLNSAVEARDAWKKGWVLDPNSDLGKKISAKLGKAK